MTATLEIRHLQTNAEQASSSVRVAGESMAFVGARPPLFVPSDQLYYWSRAWQDGEKEALADLEAGRSRVFDDLNELARYLAHPAE
jgi:hypothetical protein